MTSRQVVIIHSRPASVESLTECSLSWLERELIQRDFTVDWVLTNQSKSIEEKLEHADLIILGELRPGVDLPLVSRLTTLGTHLVLFNHGHSYCSIQTRACGNCSIRPMCRDSDRVAIYQSLVEKSSLLIYLSQLHQETSESFVGRHPEKTLVVMPPDLKAQSYASVPKLTIALHEKSDDIEWQNLLSYAHSNPATRLHVYGHPRRSISTQPTNLVVHPDLNILEQNSAAESAETFVSLPGRPIPFDENVAQRILGGKNVVTNSSVGVTHWGDDGSTAAKMVSTIARHQKKIIEAVVKCAGPQKQANVQNRFVHPLLWCHRLGLGDSINLLPFASALRETSSTQQLTWVLPKRHLELLKHELPGHYMAAEDFDIESHKSNHDIIFEVSVAMRNPTERFYSGDIIGERWIRIDLANLSTATTSIYESLLSFLGRSGIQSIPDAPQLMFSSEALERGRTTLINANIRPDQDFIVALHPGSGRTEKCWSPKRYASFIRTIKNRYRAKILLSGGIGEDSSLDEVLQHAPDIELVLRQTPLRDLAGIFGVCSMYVGNDSGPTHMAAACGTPTVALFGRTNSIRWAPTPFWTYVVQAKHQNGEASSNMNDLSVPSVCEGFRRLLLRMLGEPPKSSVQVMTSLPIKKDRSQWTTYCTELHIPNEDIAVQFNSLHESAQKHATWHELTQTHPEDVVDFANVSGLIGPSWMEHQSILDHLAAHEGTDRSNIPKIAYVIESGYQHIFPVLSMLQSLPAPVFTSGQRAAERLTKETTVFRINEKDLAKELDDHEIDIVLTTSQRFHPKLLRGKEGQRKIVYIGHGDSDKSHGQGRPPKPSFVYNSHNNEYDLLTVASTHHMERYQNPRKVLTGYLKHDLFLQGQYESIKPRKNWVLWAPGWGRHNSVRPWLSRVVEVTKALGLQCLLHVHPFSQEYEPRIVQLAQAEVLKNDHFRLAYSANILDVMATCSIMFGDVSTTCYDWLMFDRPIIFLDHPDLCIEEEKRLFRVGAHVHEKATLNSALRDAIDTPDEKSALRQDAFNTRFPQQDGNASQRVKHAVQNAWDNRWSKQIRHS